VDVAGTQLTALQVAELIEHEQRMVTGAGVMAVPVVAAPLNPEYGADAYI
jgi:hypothetical protein